MSIDTQSITDSKGTYALLLQLASPRRIRVGRLGMLDFPAGIYVYVGSAFGSGGLRARIGHHLKRSLRPHWHIDYLRRVSRVGDVWYAEGERLECAWAERLAASAVATAIPRFGCSDCRCGSHLFRVADAPRRPG